MKVSSKSFKLVSGICLFLLILLWSYTSLSKVLEFGKFEKSLLLQHFSSTAVHLLKFFIPVSELLIAVLLITIKFRSLALWLSMTMILTFTGYVAFAVTGFFENRPCACGGVLTMLSWKAHLYFNIFFSLVNLIALRLEKVRNSFTAPPTNLNIKTEIPV